MNETFLPQVNPLITVILLLPVPVLITTIPVLTASLRLPPGFPPQLMTNNTPFWCEMSNPLSPFRSLHASASSQLKLPAPAMSLPLLPDLPLRLEASPPVVRRRKKSITLSERSNVHLKARTKSQDDLPKTEVSRTLFTNKPVKEIMQELKLLESRGLKSYVGEAARFDIYKDNNDGRKNSGLSVTDLWGPNYTRKSLISMGMYEAFKTMESRDTRFSIAKESVLSARFLPRLAEDLSTMRMMKNSRLKLSVSIFDSTPSSPVKAPISERVKDLNGIMDSCTKLSVDNRNCMKELMKTKFRLKRKARKEKSNL